MNDFSILKYGKWALRFFICSSKNFRSQSHGLFIPFVSLLEFRLTFSNETYYFNSRCPRMLDKSPILNLYVKTREWFPCR